MLFTAVKFVHILLAIAAVGSNATYSVWLGRAAQSPQNLPFALRGVKFLDDYIANPSYILLLVSGLTMVLVGHISFTTFWIDAALVLWLIAIVVGYGLYTPTLRNQIGALEGAGPDSADYKRLSSRGQAVGIALGVVVLLILVVMVFKPGS